jgi:hypothetical protein
LAGGVALMFARFALWLSRGDNAFTLLLFITLPPLAALIGIGMF